MLSKLAARGRRYLIYGYTIQEIDIPLPVAIKPDIDLRIQTPKRSLAPKPVAVKLRFHVAGACLPRTDLSDQISIAAGLLKRSASRHPTPSAPVVADFMHYVYEEITKTLQPLSECDVQKRADYIDSLPHPDSMKKEYHQAHSTIVNRQHRDWNEVVRVKGFVKEEPYLEFKFDRLILPRPNTFKVIIGPVVKAIENEVYKMPQFIKKVPVEDRPAYINDYLQPSGKVVFSSDYTAFESQFVPELMKACELVLFDYMVQNLAEGPELSHIMHEYVAGLNVVTINGVTLSVMGTRMSGEMTTSLFNGFTNLMAMKFLAERAGCTGFRGVVEGDDGLFAMCSDGRFPTTQDFALLGMTIKLEQHKSVNEASFCGIVCDDESMVNVCNPLKALCNLGVVGSNYVDAKEETLDALLKCKLMSYYVQYPGCPIVEVLTSTLLPRLSHISNEQVLKHLSGSSWEKNEMRKVLGRFQYKGLRPIQHSSRLVMQEVFGISVLHQVGLEDELRNAGMYPFKSELLLSLVPKDWIKFESVYVSTVPWTDRPPSDPGRIQHILDVIENAHNPGLRRVYKAMEEDRRDYYPQTLFKRDVPRVSF